jgi:hypothetical protein
MIWFGRIEGGANFHLLDHGIAEEKYRKSVNRGIYNALLFLV